MYIQITFAQRKFPSDFMDREEPHRATTTFECLNDCVLDRQRAAQAKDYLAHKHGRLLQSLRSDKSPLPFVAPAPGLSQ